MLLSWGKPNIYVKDLDETGAEVRKLFTPVEDSTSLETSEGDKNEAKIEGGAIEDVMYKKSTFSLSCEIRMLKGRNKPFDDKDGLVAHNYEVWIQPAENVGGYGIHIPKAAVSVTTTYTSADGIKQTIKFDALENDTTTQLEVGVISVTEEGGTYTPTITPATAESETK